MSTMIAADGARAVVLVIDVDLENRLAHCQDKTKATIKVSFRDSAGGVFRIPAPGERWTVLRSGLIWRFESRLDSPQEHLDVTAVMEAGDTRLDSGGTLHVLGEGILFNGMPIGATTYSIFTANGSTTSFALLVAPVHQRTIQAFVNGLLLDPRTITLKGSTVTFLTAPAAGTLVIYYQRAGFVYEDSFTVRGTANISAVDIGPYNDAGTVAGHAVPSATGSYTPSGGGATGSP